MNEQYLYPQNLKSQAKLWLWNLRDIAIIGTALLLSVLAIAQLKIILPLGLTLGYALDDNKQVPNPKIKYGFRIHQDVSDMIDSHLPVANTHSRRTV